MADDSVHELKEKAVRGTFWTGGGQIVRQVVQILTSVMLARLLVPEDFGLIAMAMVFVGVAQLIADFGIGAAIVQRDSVSDRILSSCFWINLAISAALAAFVALSAGLVADFYGNDRVEMVLRILSLNLVLAGMLVLPRALLYRNMDFQSVAMAEVTGTAVGSTTAILLAWNGHGVLALIAQPLVGGSAMLAVTWVRSRWLPRLCVDVDSIRDMIGFSVNLLGTNLLNFVNRKADNFIVGKMIGSHAAGIYAFAYQLMLYPLGQVSTVIVKVLFPTLSKMKHDLTEFAQTYLGAVRFISLVTFPLMIGLFMVADVFVPTVFGEQWSEMVPILKVFCFAGMAQSITTVVGTIYMSTGEVKAMFRITVLQTPIQVFGFLLGAYFGLFYVALIYMLISLGFFVWMHLAAFRFVDIRFVELLRVLAPQLLCTGIMAVALVVSAALMSGADLGPVLWLLIQIPLGGVVYLLSTWLFNDEVVRVIRSRFLKGKAA